MQFLQHVKDFLKTASFVLFVIITQGWQALGIIFISILNNRPWECLFIFIGFVMGRHFFGKSYHAPSLWVCTIITWGVFYFLTSAIPTFQVSVTLPCVFGVGLAYALSRINDFTEQKGARNG